MIICDLFVLFQMQASFGCTYMIASDDLGLMKTAMG